MYNILLSNVMGALSLAISTVFRMVSANVYIGNLIFTDATAGVVGQLVNMALCPSKGTSEIHLLFNSPQAVLELLCGLHLPLL